MTCAVIGQAEAYDQYRGAHQRVAAAVIGRFIDAKMLAAAARLLDIDVDDSTGKVVLQSAAEEPPLLDFAMCDVRTAGVTAVQTYIRSIDASAASGPEAEDEAHVLAALASSRPSLYEIVRRAPEAGTAELTDLLDGGRLVVTDRALSMGGPAPTAAFLRILRLGELNMTSGMALAFPGAAAPEIISKHDEIAKRSKRRPEIIRFGSFFRLHRLYGAAVGYAASPGAAGS